MKTNTKTLFSTMFSTISVAQTTNWGFQRPPGRLRGIPRGSPARSQAPRPIQEADPLCPERPPDGPELVQNPGATYVSNIFVKTQHIFMNVWAISWRPLRKSSIFCRNCTATPTAARNSTIIQSYNLTILQSYSLTILQSYNLTIFQSYKLTILQSYNRSIWLTVLRPDHPNCVRLSFCNIVIL